MIGCIALDMDGILYDWDFNVRRLAVADLGVEDWGPAKTWSIPFLASPEGQEWYQANLHRVFMQGSALPGVNAWARRLYLTTSNLHIVTAGEPEVEAYKKLWLARNDIRYDRFTLLPKGHPKSEVGADLYIDDGAHVVDEVLDHTNAYAILLDAAYNRGPEHPKHEGDPRLLRAYSWHGIVKMAEHVDYVRAVARGDERVG